MELFEKLTVVELVRKFPQLLCNAEESLLPSEKRIQRHAFSDTRLRVIILTL